MAAAKIMGQKILRFNMSSRISVDDLLGKVELERDPNNPARVKPVLREQPFTEAFRTGKWLLLGRRLADC